MTDVTTTQEHALANVDDLAAWGEEPQVDSKDIVLPRVYLMQAISQLVEEEKAKSGQFVNSLTEELLGDSEVPFVFTPFKIEKLWFVYKVVGGQNEFVTIEPVTAANINRPQSELVDGEEMNYQYALRAYVLVEGDDLPMVVTFKSTSLRAGKQLFTEMFVKNKMAGKNPASRQMELTSRKEKNDKGTYYVMSLKAGEDSDVETQKNALMWVKTLSQQTYSLAGEEEGSAKATETQDY